jgi:hypothetical protein
LSNTRDDLDALHRHADALASALEEGIDIILSLREDRQGLLTCLRDLLGLVLDEAAFLRGSLPVVRAQAMVERGEAATEGPPEADLS